MKIGIIGITGKMGCILSDIIAQEAELTLTGGISSKNSEDDICELAKNSDILVDFSQPKPAMSAMSAASKIGIPIVSGTTGLSENDFNEIRKFSSLIPILHASNFSIGVQLMSILLKKASEILTEFDVSIVDKHHNKKKDSPSGTALFLKNAIGRVDTRVASIRAGGIFGDHSCDFAGENEMLTISHRAFNRKVFAEGAVACAKWIIGKNPGLYTMIDYLRIADGG